MAEMGFPIHWCERALAETGDDIEAALNWILSNGELLSVEDSLRESIQAQSQAAAEVEAAEAARAEAAQAVVAAEAEVAAAVAEADGAEAEARAADGGENGVGQGRARSGEGWPQDAHGQQVREINHIRDLWVCLSVEGVLNSIDEVTGGGAGAGAGGVSVVRGIGLDFRAQPIIPLRSVFLFQYSLVLVLEETSPLPRVFLHPSLKRWQRNAEPESLLIFDGAEQIAAAAASGQIAVHGWPRVFHCDLSEVAELPLLAEPRFEAEQVRMPYRSSPATVDILW